MPLKSGTTKDESGIFRGGGFTLRWRILAALVLACGIMIMPALAQAKDPATFELSLEKAVEMAIASSKALQSAQYEVDRAWEVREKAADNVKYIPAGPISGDAAAQAAAAFTGLVQADLNWQMKKKAYEATKDSVVMAVYKAYYQVLSAQEYVRVKEAALKSAEWQRRVASDLYRVGMMSRSDYLKSATGIDGARAALEEARKALDDAYQQFNQLIGLWPEDRPVLTSRPKYEPLAVDSLDAAVERAVEESPTVWLAKSQVDYYKLRLDLYPFNSPSVSDPYDAWKIDVSKAEVSAASTAEQLRTAVRNIYYSAKQAEEKYEAARQNLEATREDLRVARLKFELGMATKVDVLSAEAKVAEAEKALLDIAASHEILAMAFAKPWVSSGGAGAGTSSGAGSSSGSSTQASR